MACRSTGLRALLFIDVFFRVAFLALAFLIAFIPFAETFAAQKRKARSPARLLGLFLFSYSLSSEYQVAQGK
jgi:hypothetical protein